MLPFIARQGLKGVCLMSDRNLEFNPQYKEIFGTFDKAAAFDELASLFYNRNFSSTSKSEIELLMFHFYMRATVEKYQSEDGRLDYSKCSNLEMGRQLGIPQERVRTLKVKAHSRFPISFDWKKSLESIKDNIVYEDNKIVIPIIDPNLLNEIRNYVEINGGFVIIENSQSYIKLRVNHYLMLMYYTLGDVDKKAFLKALKKETRDKNQYEDVLETQSRKEILAMIEDCISTASDITSIISNLTSAVNLPNALVSVLKSVFNLRARREDEE